MTKWNTNAIKQLILASIVMTLVACGADEKAKEAPKDKPDPENPTVEAPRSLVQDGKYYLSSGTFEGSDAQGNKIDKQTLQIAGDYFWEMKHQGSEKYEVTATGSVKLSTDNQVVAEVNCIGSQDVYAFEITTSGALRNFAQLEAGCPQGTKLNASQQMSIRSLNDNTFEYTVVNQANGARIVEAYVFRK